MRQEKADLPISFQKQYFHNINKEECIYYLSIHTQIAKNNKRLALQIQASSVRLQRVEIQND